MYFGRPGHTGESPPLLIDTDKLDAAIRVLNGAIAQWIVTTVHWEYRGDDERQPALEALRNAGQAVFKLLEGDKPGVLRAYLSGVTYLEIHIRRRHIPWEFLYLGDAAGEVDLTKFLGYQLVVGRPMPLSVLPNNPQAPANDREERALNLYLPTLEDLVVGVAEDQALDSALDGHERGIFAAHGVAMDVLPTIHSSRQWYQIEAFVEQSPYLTHFNCHAVAEDLTSGRPGEIQVSDDFKIARTKVGSLPVCEESIIVLNCCHGHTLEHAATDTLATEFAQRKVAAVVASTERLIDDHATLWARHFYAQLFAGAAVGPALLAARQEVMNATSNPASLVYGFFGRHSAKLVASPQELAA